MNQAADPAQPDLTILQRQNDELRVLVDVLQQRNRELEETIAALKGELDAQKNLPEKPKLKASKLNRSDPKAKGFGPRAGSAKRSKKATFEVDEERKIEPPDLPEDARLHQYRPYDVQELSIERRNIRFLLGEYELSDGQRVRAALPPEYQQTGHYGPTLVSYILYEYYQNRVSQPLIREHLQEWGIDISVGHINQLLTEGHERFEAEQDTVLRVGLEQSDYIHTDDTGARHQGKNGYTTVIGNDWFTYFQSSDSKSRENFLHILQGGHPVYVLNEESRQYLEGYALGQNNWQALTFSDTVLATDETQWQQQLEALGITTPRAVKWVTEAALLGGLMTQGLSASLMLLSDGAPQFRLFTHALCWVHAERILRKLPGSTAEFRANIETAQTQLWEYYQALKAYQRHPTETEKAHLWQRFDVIFGHIYPHHASLNLALASLMQHKEQLLRVLDFPDLPLHNNAAETDIREYVTRRKISGGTRSDVGRQARDTFIGIKKTCRKLGISFWRYLCSRFRQDTTIAPLPEILLQQILEMKVVSIPT